MLRPARIHFREQHDVRRTVLQPNRTPLPLRIGGMHIPRSHRQGFPVFTSIHRSAARTIITPNHRQARRQQSQRENCRNRGLPDSPPDQQNNQRRHPIKPHMRQPLNETALQPQRSSHNAQACQRPNSPWQNPHRKCRDTAERAGGNYHPPTYGGPDVAQTDRIRFARSGSGNAPLVPHGELNRFTKFREFYRRLK